MTVTEKFNHAWRYMFERGNITYWLGATFLNLIIQELLLHDFFSALVKIGRHTALTQAEQALPMVSGSRSAITIP